MHRSRKSISAATCLGWIALAFFIGQLAMPCCGQMGSSSVPTKVRRVFVPVLRLGEISDQAIPVARSRLEDLLAERSTDLSAREGYAIAALKFRGTWENPRFLRGTVSLEFGPATFTGDVLTLGPWSLPIQNAVLEHSNGKQSNKDVAFDAAGHFRVHRQNAAALHVDVIWRGDEAADGAFLFESSLPKSLRSEIEIRHPAKYFLRGSAADGDGKMPSEDQQSTVLSRLEFVGTLRELQLLPRETLAHSELGWYHESMNIRAGIVRSTFESRVRIEPYGDLPLILRLKMSPGLQVHQVVAEEKPLGFWVDETGEERSLLVELPRSRAAGDLTLEIQGELNFPLGKNGRVPSFSSEHFSWGSQFLRFESEAPLVVQDLNFRDAELLALQRPDDRGAVTEQLEFKYLKPDAQIRLRLGTEPLSTAVNVMESVVLGTEKSQLQGKIGLQVQAGRSFNYAFGVRSGWRLETVESVGGNRIDDWYQEPRGDQWLIHVRFESPLQASDKIELQFAGEGPGFADAKSIPTAELQVIQPFNDFRESHQLQIRADLGLSIQDRNPLFPDNPAQAFGMQQDADTPGPGALLINAIAIPPEDEILLERAESTFDAVPETVADWLPGQVSQRFRIRFATRPDSTQVLAEISPPDVNDIAWTLGGDNPRRVPAVRLGVSADAPGVKEEWMISIPAEATTTFEIVGERVVRKAAQDREPWIVPIMTLPASSAAEGILRVRICPEFAANWDLKSRLPRISSQEKWHLFTYPARELDPKDHNATIVPRPVSLPYVWASTAEVTTRWHPGQPAWNEAKVELMVIGDQSIRIRQREGLEIQRVELDRELVAKGQSGWDLELVADASPRRLTIQYTTSPTPLAFARSFQIQVPDLGIPVLLRDYKLWIPPGFWGDAIGDHKTSGRPWNAPFSLLSHTKVPLMLGLPVSEMGWEVVQNQTGTFRLVSLKSTVLVGWAITHLLAALMAFRRLGKLHVMGLGAVALLLLLLPSVVSDCLGSAILMGMLLGGVFRVARNFGPGLSRLARRAWPKISLPRLVRMLPFLLTVTCLTSLGIAQVAQLPSARIATEEKALPAVKRYVPIDALGRVLGEYDYLDSADYARLLAGSQTSYLDEGGVVSARYRIDFSERDGDFFESLFEVELEVKNSRPAETLRIPWKLPPSRTVHIEAWFDDDSVRVSYVMDLQEIHLDVSASVGQHHVRLRFPRGNREPIRGSVWRLPLPPCGAADLELRIPRGEVLPMISGIRGRVVYSSVEHLYRAELGPTNELQIHFRGPPVEFEDMAGDIAEVVDCQSGRIRVDVYARVAEAYELSDVEFRTSARLTFLYDLSSDPEHGDHRIEDESSATLEPEMQRQVLPKEATHVSGGVLHFAFTLRPEDLATYRPGKWFSPVRSADRRVYVILSQAQAESHAIILDARPVTGLSADQAAEAFREFPVELLSVGPVYEIPDGQSAASHPIAVVQDEPVTQIEDLYELDFSDQARGFFTATFTNQTRAPSVIRLKSPQGTRMNMIQLRTTEKAVPVKVSLDDNGGLALFPLEPLSTPFVVEGRYEFTIQRDKEFALPRIEFNPSSSVARRGVIRYPQGFRLETSFTVQPELEKAEMIPSFGGGSLLKGVRFTSAKDLPLRVRLHDLDLPRDVSQDTEPEGASVSLKLVDVWPGPEQLQLRVQWWLPMDGLTAPELTCDPRWQVLGISLGSEPMRFETRINDKLRLPPLVTHSSMPLVMWCSLSYGGGEMSSVAPPTISPLRVERTLWRFFRTQDRPSHWNLRDTQRLSAREFEGDCLAALLRLTRQNANRWLQSNPSVETDAFWDLWQEYVGGMHINWIADQGSDHAQVLPMDDFLSEDERAELRAFAQVVQPHAAARLPIRANGEVQDSQSRVARFASKQEAGLLWMNQRPESKHSLVPRLLRGFATLFVLSFILWLVRLGR